MENDPTAWRLLRRLLSTDGIVVLRGPDGVDVFVPTASVSDGALAAAGALAAGATLPQELLDELLANVRCEGRWTFYHAASLRSPYVYLCPPGGGEPVRFSVVGLPRRQRNALLRLERGADVPPATVGALISPPAEPRTHPVEVETG